MFSRSFRFLANVLVSFLYLEKTSTSSKHKEIEERNLSYFFNNYLDVINFQLVILTQI